MQASPSPRYAVDVVIEPFKDIEFEILPGHTMAVQKAWLRFFPTDDITREPQVFRACVKLCSKDLADTANKSLTERGFTARPESE